MGPTLMPQLRVPRPLRGARRALPRGGRRRPSSRRSSRSSSATAGSSRARARRTGRTVEGYLAIVGVGVVPNVELAEAAGADVDDGIVVDERFRTSLPDVYAIGDVARYPDPTSGRLAPDRALVECRRPGRAPRSPARGLASRVRRAAGLLHAALRAASSRCSATSEPAVECVLRGSLAEGRLIGFHLSEERRLVGAVVHGQAADVADGARGADPASGRSSTTPPGSSTSNLRPAEAVVA